MFIIKSIITSGFFFHVKPSHNSKTRALSPSSTSFGTSKNHGPTLFGDNNGNKHYKSTTRRFLVHSVVEPGAPLPPEPPFNFLNWIVGIAFSVVLPFLSNKWTSLLRIKDEVESAVEMAEEIVVAVEKVTERVEKAAEEMLEDLPAGGRLRKAVDFVEHIAERANRDAHILGDFIDKVQEVEEEVDECVESLATTHKHHKEEDLISIGEPTSKEGNIDIETHKQ